MGARVPPIDTVIFKQHQRLVAVLLGTEGACFFPLAVHHPAAVVMDAEDGGHTVSALRPLEGGGEFLGIPGAAGGRSRPGTEPGGKHTGVSLARQAAPAAQGGMAFLGQKACSRPLGGDARHKGLGLHPWLCGQCRGNIPQIPHFIPLVTGNRLGQPFQKARCSQPSLDFKRPQQGSGQRLPPGFGPLDNTPAGRRR